MGRKRASGVQPPSAIVGPLRRAINETELPLTELARQSGVSHPQLYRFVAGKRDLLCATADRLAAVLGLELNVVTKGKKR